MRLVSVEFLGYKRLIETRFYVDQKIIALVGPNEAGKSSVLEGLRLFNDGEPVPNHCRPRSTPFSGEGDPFARLVYRLEPEDHEALVEVPIQTMPEQLTITKSVDGRFTWGFSPTLKYPSAIARDAQAALVKLEGWIDKKAKAQSDEEQKELMDATGAINGAIVLCDVGDTKEISDDDKESVDWEIIDKMMSQYKSVGGKRGAAHAEGYKRFHENRVTGTHLWDQVHGILRSRVPQFRLFSNDERQLEYEYDLEGFASGTEAPIALRNLLSLVDLTVNDVLEVLGDGSRTQTLLKRANITLRELFMSSWRQSSLMVKLDLEGSRLRIYIEEDSDPAVVAALSERSDGLRIFVALTAFLGPRPGRPSILLIDEAETHLHYNAQADLVNILTSQTQSSQVIYTTHSPGCLPRDMGTCVRFIEPDASGAESSEVRHDFWSRANSSVGAGFSPLLFVMGAGAAAFAHLRRSVIAEGPSDMILLPSMIRAATGASELPYQVAPGISIQSKESFVELQRSAVDTFFVIDGDEQGKIWRDQLLSAGVPSQRLFSLSDDETTEDLITADSYARAIQPLIAETGAEISAQDLPSPRRLSLKHWASERSVRPPGSIAVAEQLLMDWMRPGIGPEITPEGKRTLRRLDRNARRAMGL